RDVVHELLLRARLLGAPLVQAPLTQPIHDPPLLERGRELVQHRGDPLIRGARRRTGIRHELAEPVHQVAQVLEVPGEAAGAVRLREPVAPLPPQLLKRVQRLARPLRLALRLGQPQRRRLLLVLPQLQHLLEWKAERAHAAASSRASIAAASSANRLRVSAKLVRSSAPCRRKERIGSRIRIAVSSTASLPCRYAPTAIRSSFSRYAASSFSTASAARRCAASTMRSRTRLVLSRTSMAGTRPAVASRRLSTMCPSRIDRTASATGSLKSSPSTSTV